MKKNIEILPYDPAWPVMFESESRSIRHILGDHCRAIYHIGSTAVPGLSAKPVLDILCVVDWLSESLLLADHGYTFKGEINIPLRYYFSKNTDVSKVNLHVVEPDHGFIALNLTFRDYVRTHKDACQAYQQLKYNIIKDSSSADTVGGLPKYTLEKDAFIKEILKKSKFAGVMINFCTHYHEWREYHRIAKQQLYDPYGRLYDQKDLSQPAEGHYYFVLYVGICVVTIAHIQLLNTTDAAVRKLATDEPYKAKGYGKQMLQFIEKWLAYKKYTVIKLHSSPGAQGFYRSLGYVDIVFDEPRLVADVIDLGKMLS